MAHPFVLAFNKLQKEIQKIDLLNGKKDQTHGESIAFIHLEISKALEAIKDENSDSDKMSNFKCVEEELADAIIKIMKFAKSNDFRIAEAIIAKIEYNKNQLSDNDKVS